jgi:SAM-dependent MidA family methyltransferase
VLTDPSLREQLPAPDAVALEHSERLVGHISERISAGGGSISFAEFMELALYAPGLGYYSAGAAKLGADGDFVTAPEISGLYSSCVAGQCAEVLAQTGNVILELGAGSGRMAADMLAELERLDQLPDDYLILEASADLRSRQQANLESRVPHLRSRVSWLDASPAAGSISGVIVANEVLDALPVERFVVTPEGLHEQVVIVRHGQLAVDSRRAGDALRRRVAALQEALGVEFAAGYVGEVSPLLPGWVASLSEWLSAGAALLFDYGFPRHEFYRPDRDAGTLRCFYRHRAHDDPLLWPGLQDITAWVDFSAVAAAAEAAGMEVAGYTTQAAFLLAAGLDERVAAAATSGPIGEAEMAHGLRQLLLPGEMGETVKAIALTKGGTTAPTGFTGKDMRTRL